MKTSDVVISGGGVPGLVLGSLLAKEGLEVCIIDPVLPPEPSSVKPSARTAALMEDSLAILKEAGIWNKDLEANSTDLRHLAIIDTSQHSMFDAAELGKARFGSNIVNGLLLAHAAKHARTLKNLQLIHSSVQDFSISRNAVTISVANGDALATPLLIGADGRNSIVRKISGIGTNEHDYGQMAITALLSHTKPHDFTSTEFHRPGGPFTLVPMPGNTSSLVWLEPADEAERLLRLKKKDFEQALQDISQGLLGEITLLIEPEAWPLKNMAAKSFIAPRVVLIAEAAHVLSPIGAQGLNLSLRDASILAKIILEARSCGLDIGSPAVLKKYDRSRKVDTGLRVAGTHALNQIVATDSSMLASIRQLGLRLVSGVSPLRRLAMREGLSPDYATSSGRTTRAKVTTSTR